MRISDWSSDVCSSDLVVHHEKDVHAAQFLDPLVLRRVEEDDLVAAMADRLLLRHQRGGIVAAAFGRARAAARGAGEMFRHPKRDRLLPALEISAGGRRSAEHTSDLQSLMRISTAVFCSHINITHTINT